MMLSTAPRAVRETGRLWTVAVLISALAACATKAASTPLPGAVAREGLRIDRSLPADLPDESARLPNSQFVLISTDNVAGLLMPVPFVAEAVAGALNQHEANALAKRYASVDPYAIVSTAMQGSPLLRTGGGVVLHPLAFLVDCSDARYRVALAARMASGSWNGSYMVHLPTTYSHAALAEGGAAAIAPMRGEMAAAAVTLRRLIEQDARGELTRPLYTADVGSLHLACSTVSGVVSARLIRSVNTEVVEEGSDYVVVRMAGKLTDSGPLGGLMFGLHYLRKDQLDTFKRH
jgi:hypothetical protein